MTDRVSDDRRVGEALTVKLCLEFEGRFRRSGGSVGRGSVFVGRSPLLFRSFITSIFRGTEKNDA